MLAPGDGSDHVQVIDVRDLAQFGRWVIEHDLGGAFNLAGPRLTWTEFMQVLGAENLVWVAAGIIRAAGATEFELPLFRTELGPRSGLMEVSNEQARARRSHPDRSRRHRAGHAGLDSGAKPAPGAVPCSFASQGGRVDQPRPPRPMRRAIKIVISGGNEVTSS